MSEVFNENDSSIINEEEVSDIDAEKNVDIKTSNARINIDFENQKVTSASSKNSESNSFPNDEKIGGDGSTMSRPRPEDVEKEIQELMREKFGDSVKIVSQPVDLTDMMSDLDQVLGDKKTKEKKDIDLSFDFLPKDLKSYLDKYIIKQDLAKKALAISVCDHYNHIRRCHELKKNGQILDDNFTKQNILMMGPTGVGKTYLIKTIANLVGVPFIKADATRFTETGFVGASVDDLVKDLVAMAGGDIELAQYGIIYFDEVDKLAGASNVNGKEVGRRGVQYGLLKLMEDTEIDLQSGSDPMSQLKAFMNMQKGGKSSKKVISTKHILFIVSGAFSGLEEIIKNRMNFRSVGLLSNGSISEKEVDDDIFKHATTKDLVEFGLEPEFIGRLPVRLSCQNLGIDDLYHVLKDSKGSIIQQYKESFAFYGIDIYFKDSGLRRIAELAYEEKTGARSLMNICEKTFREFKFELPSTNVKAIIIDKEFVNSPEEVLQRVLTDKEKNKSDFFEILVHKEEEKFKQINGVEFKFSDNAIEDILKQTEMYSGSVEEVCRDIFNLFLETLLSCNLKEFKITRESLENPPKYISEIIKSSIQ